MPSIQENLARVRSSLADHDAITQHHADILSTHDADLRSHEASLRRERHRSHKRKADSDLRFRFKRSAAPPRKVRRSTTPPADPAGVGSFTSHPLPRAPASPTLETPDDKAPAPDPDAAFTASLFDALADDEGAAAYWESVYAQPVHVYSRPTVETAQGELEAMTDEEYARYVKRKMWEKLHPEEMREIRLREQRKREEEERRERRRQGFREDRRRSRERSRERARDEVQAALDRGQMRREVKMWEKRWEAYQQLWRGEVQVEKLPWPTEEGKTPTEGGEEVRVFFKGVMRYVLPGLLGNDADRTEMEGAKRTLLKAERFRWHPDKMMQRFGDGLKDSPEVLAAVTGVFQVVDAMLGEMRK